MKKNVMVIGMGLRRAGTSKKGNAYDFIPMTFSYTDKSFEGVRAFEVNVDSAELETVPGLCIGEEITVYCHEQNFQMRLDGIVGRA